VEDDELAGRREAWKPSHAVAGRGYTWLYQQHVLQADQGCDFDFLVDRAPGWPVETTGQRASERRVFITSPTTGSLP
jgi:hypothetical protein